MAHRILVFESDTAFTQSLKDGFAGRDVALEIVADGNVGLRRAEEDKPDLFLISIELPNMNGFSVCKKLKKNEALKGVPTIILSSDPGADVIFEQHKKLRTRAEEYVQKPVEFLSLLETIRTFVPVGESSGDTSVVVGETPAPIAPEPTAVHDVDDEIDAFAEDAFDALMVEEEIEIEEEELEERTSIVSAADIAAALSDAEHSPVVSTPPAPPSMPPVPAASAAPPAPPSAPSVAPPAPSLAPPAPSVAPPAPSVAPAPESVLPAASVPAAPAAPAVDEAELQSLQEEVAALRQAHEQALEAQAAAEADAEAARSRVEVLEGEGRDQIGKIGGLEREVAELKAKGGGGGISSREFLDLREKLNNKDKELLDLRDQLTSRDKELIELRDRSLGVERAKADVEDKALGLERQLADQGEKLSALEADKQTVSKNLEDTKGRLERTEEKAKRLEDEFNAAKEAHSTELQGLKSTHDEAMASATSANEEAQAEAKAKAAAELAAASEAHEAALAALKSEHEEASKTAAESHESALTAEKDAAAQALLDAEEKFTGETAALKAEQAKVLEDAKSELTKAKEDALAELELELEAKREEALASKVEELTKAKDDALAAKSEEHSKELAVLGRKLADVEGKGEEQAAVISSLEARKAELEEAKTSGEKALGDAEAKIADLEARLAKATGKLEADAQILERVHRAMSIGLGLLEEQKQNAMNDAAE